jgi:hypothetical protein
MPGSQPGSPSVARVYDYLLGGSHNFAADRERAAQLLRADPMARDVARQNRAFLARAVRWMVDQGIRQFLDLGSGIPTRGNVHEQAQAANADCKVVYVDIDPVAVASSTELLYGNKNAIAMQADLRKPAELLASPELNRLLDLGRPVGVLLLAVMPFVPDDEEAASIFGSLCKTITTGSYIAISHRVPRPDSHQVPARLRSPAEIHKLLGGLKLVPPGLVPLPQWKPGDGDNQGKDSPLVGGIARKGD